MPKLMQVEGELHRVLSGTAVSVSGDEKKNEVGGNGLPFVVEVAREGGNNYSFAQDYASLLSAAKHMQALVADKEGCLYGVRILDSVSGTVLDAQRLNPARPATAPMGYSVRVLNAGEVWILSSGSETVSDAVLCALEYLGDYDTLQVLGPSNEVVKTISRPDIG